MATLALTAVAGGFGLTGTSLIAANMAAGIVGGVIDSHMFARSPRGQALDTLPINTYSEGSPVWKCYGPSNRIPCQLIWVGPIRQVGRARSGGKGRRPRQARHHRDAVYAICEGPIEAVTAVYANGRNIYAQDRDVSVTGDDLTLTRLSSTGNAARHCRIVAPPNGTNLRQFEAGHDVVMTGWANGDNNITGRCYDSGSLGDGSTYIKVRKGSVMTDAVFVNESAGATVTIEQALPSTSEGYVSGIGFKLGTESQPPSSLIEQFEGAGNVPGHRGLALLEVYGLEMEKFGGSFPSFTVTVKQSASITLRDAVTSILLDRGVPNKRIDVTGIDAGRTVDGYALRGPTSGRAALEPLSVAYDLVSQEDSGVVRVYDRQNAPVYAIQAGDLASRPLGQDAPHVVRLSDVDRTNLPAMVTVRYNDPANRDQAGEQSYRGQQITRNAVWSVDLQGLAMSDERAQALARRIYWTAYANRLDGAIQLPPSYADLLEGDVARVTQDGETYDLLLSTLDVGANGAIEAHGVREIAATLSLGDTTPDTEGGVDDVEPGFDLGEVFGTLIDIAPLSDEHVYSPGYYLAVSPSSQDQVWSGATAYISKNGGTSWEEIAEIATPATRGRTTDALPAPVTTTLWDAVSEVNVELEYGELESKSETEVLQGENWALVGDEIIGFRDATLETDGTYTLSYLLRGLRATEYVVGDHAVFDRFALLDEALVFVPSNISERGLDVRMIYVPEGGDFDDYQWDGEEWTLESATIRPFPASDLRGRILINNDWRINWDRRSRAMFDPLSQPGPLLDPPELWEVDIYDGPDVVRTISSSTHPVFYTEAEQIADFGSAPLSDIDIAVYLVSPIYGRGKVASANVTPTP